jgi:hypothetical protein
MDGRINIAKAPELMVSRRRPSPVEKANPASVPGPNSPLENTPHKARVIGNRLLRASVALLQVRAKSGGSACADVSECSALMGIQHMPPVPEKLLFVLAKDIGDFQPMFGHRCRPSSFERSMGLSWRLSNGFGAACIRTVETRRYRAVV